ncbi:MAG: penicillin-binding transpeptidase domain-containing protein [Baekduia sp.]
MPLDPANDRRPPITPQLAIRVAGAGVVAFVLFGIIFFRLWYLEVLDGDKYLAQARENRVRTERIPAPRGQIVDANKVVIVDNRKATVVSLNPASIPPQMREAIATYGQRFTARSKRRKGHQGPRPPLPQPTGALLARYERLGKVLGLSVKTINQRVVTGILQVPYADVRIRTGVPASQRNYIQERSDQFPGVTVAQLYVRQYPYRSTAAQVLGSIGQIDRDQLTQSHFKGVAAGTDIGKAGLEYEYDKLLRGTDGSLHIEVNAAGERRRASTVRQPKQGRELKLTLRLDVQQAGESALRTAGHGLPGAFVALNPENGAVYGMGSSPTFNPRDLNGPFATNAAYEAKFGKAAGSPLFNRADMSAYPTGSIFKPITSLAALSEGLITPSEKFNDTGCFQTGARKIDKSCNAGGKVYGPVNMVDALRVSSDTYYYNLGKKLFERGGLALQKWARDLGVGRRSGIDLPSEARGALPSPAKIRELQDYERKCRKREHKANCYIADLSASWNPGDMTNFAVGQGGLQATPLQMATAYATIINRGRVPTPHLAEQVEDSRGVVEKIDKPSKRKVAIKEEWRTAIMEGLSEAANQDGGTSKQVWDQGWPRDRFPIFGKTGTAERIGQADQSWYVAYSYDHTPERKPILVVVTVEKGGFGAESAAPAARLILSKWFNVSPKLIRGSSQDT